MVLAVRDRFVWQPIAVAVALYLLTIAPLRSAHLLGSERFLTLWGVLTVPFLLVAAAVLLGIFVLALVHRQWRRAISMVLAALAFWLTNLSVGLALLLILPRR